MQDPGERITYFAETDARGKRTPFGIKSKDRTKHVYVIGKTGMGKSTLLENMAIQDMQNGEGIAFIDPHGKTADLLLDYVPQERIKDVIYFAPFDIEHPISFNVMEDVGADKRHLVVNGLMSTFEKIWVDAWSARMAYILNNTLLALLEYPGSTLLGVNRMLADKDYRKKVVDNIKDPSVKAFWVEEFGKYTERFAAEATPAIQNKVGQFTSNPLVRNLIGQPESTFDFRKVMDEKKILIVNLSKGRVGEGNANLIGSMLITKLYLAAMSRADASETMMKKLPPFYLYVDEFQSFANKSFADILSEARKYKLNLTIAHQYIEQMEEEVRDAVFGNVGTMITFRVGAYDAEVLEKEFAPVFTAEDLVNLGIFQAYLKLMIDGVGSQPFSASTLPPIKRPEFSFKDDIIESSRKQFSRPRAEVEASILKWHEPIQMEKVEKKEKPPERQSEKPKEHPPERPRHDRSNDRPVEHKNNMLGKEIARQLEEAKKQEVFKEKSPDVVVTHAQPTHHKIAEHKPVSLHELKKPEKKDGKGPGEKNLSELKAALNDLVKKVETNTVTPRQAKPETKPDVKNAAPDSASHSVRATSGKEKKEVSEEVLRKILQV